MKILIAEDDIFARSVLEASLRKLGHELVSYADGEAAWTAFMMEPQRVVISDWLMPGMDGLELCRRIRNAGGDYTYFILLSNLSATGENLDQAMAAGVDDFLAKPANPNDLRARLHVADRILNYATQVQQLESFIPICSYCKKVRDDEDYWHTVESYISHHTNTRFSHGVCPECMRTHIEPELARLEEE